MPIIVNQKPTYNQSLSGVFGEFGQGGGAQIFFMQTAIRPKDLGKIALVSDIEGSEQWEVRDLFQRDVDIQRVSEGLVPYLLDTNSIKFFNPLTLTFIPPQAGNNEFTAVIPKMDFTTQQVDGYSYQCIENAGNFRFRHVTDSHENGVVEWNDSTMSLVAIDGQHRLSALKNIWDDKAGRQHIDFESWTIPVVIFGVRSIDEERTRSQRTLDVIRRTFVYINTEAKAPTPTRQILLNDSLVNEICTQEFVQHFHSNDCKSKPDPDVLPLFVFNWRGAQKNSRTQKVVGALQSVADIRDWLEYYILGENWSADQQLMLNVQPVGATKALKNAFNARSLAPASIKTLRQQFNMHVLPGLAHIMQQFDPLKSYGAEVRNIEKTFLERTPESRHAFQQFRFGGSKAHHTLTEIIGQVEMHIEEEINDAYSKIPDLLQKDIGMRGIMYACGHLYDHLRKDLGFNDFMAYAVWFTDMLNKLNAEGWFGNFRQGASQAARQVAPFHVQITISHQDSTINYRLNDAKGALGGLLVMLISAQAATSGKLGKSKFNEYFGNARERVQSTLISGYKKQVGPQIKESMPDKTVKEQNKVIKKEAEKKASEHLSKLEAHIRLGEIE